MLVLLVKACLPLHAQATATKLSKMDTEVIELNRYGFYPTQISRSGGQFFLYVRNATGLRAYSLQLLRQTGQAEKQKAISNQVPNWKEALDIAPGTYTLTEASHPAWTCKITIR